jgi:diguanylate cyclase (GGDEF)-like protein
MENSKSQMAQDTAADGDTTANNTLETSVKGAAREQRDGLGARPIGRILVLSLDEPAGNAMREVRDALENAGHTVAAASFEQWRAALASTQPDAVVLEAADITTAGQLSRALRSENHRLSILAVLPSDDKWDLAQTMWADLQYEGADDFICANHVKTVLGARMAVMLRLAQVGHELVAVRDRLARHMQIDETTQLLNRRFFFQNSHRECSRARRYGNELSCLMIDIDFLDDIQKKFGYACVEYVLRAVAYTVRQWTRDSDIAGRFSDRKFAVLLPETDVEGATTVREKILEALEESRFEWEGEEVPVAVSIGESQRRVEMSSPDVNAPSETISEEFGAEPLSVREELAALLEDADAALSVARRATLRPAVFTPYSPGIEESA